MYQLRKILFNISRSPKPNSRYPSIQTHNLKGLTSLNLTVTGLSTPVLYITMSSIGIQPSYSYYNLSRTFVGSLFASLNIQAMSSSTSASSYKIFIHSGVSSSPSQLNPDISTFLKFSKCSSISFSLMLYSSFCYYYCKPYMKLSQKLAQI
eukprot:EC095714.1.p3 GENE.EC095714.1~~EC095714.1.p3  ORF type:complete len:151 (-),score=6.43 EC095714.1:92-544(-)